MFTLKQGNSLEELKHIPTDSIDSIVTDPPYELGFMGKKWDATGIAYNLNLWKECLRVLKPGGHLLAFSGSRTYHRMTCAIEDAGFEVRDQIMWVYGSGFPKSLDVSKAIDKAAGAEREVVGVAGHSGVSRSCMAGDFTGGDYMATAPATKAAKKWQGWGTALKPAHEPICVARKPLIGTVADNVLKHGTGALNVDGCRVDTADVRYSGGQSFGAGHIPKKDAPAIYTAGRWPANLIHDGSEEVCGLLGSAARFFYCAKASKRDRDEGCEGLESRELKAYGDFAGNAEHGPKLNVRARNHHPTVKPTDLMRYLCRLVTPPNGTILDPFTGSGSTGKAAILEGFNFIGIEMQAEYVAIAEARIAAARKEIESRLL